MYRRNTSSFREEKQRPRGEESGLKSESEREKTGAGALGKEPVGCEAKRRTGRQAENSHCSECKGRLRSALTIKTWARRRARGTARTAAWLRRRGPCRDRGMRSLASARAIRSPITCNHNYWSVNTMHWAVRHTRRDATQRNSSASLILRSLPLACSLSLAFPIDRQLIWVARTTG